ncbi:MAG: 4'-phosphopantetheinyl transferase family protein [Actinomycetota bacterium]
MLSAATVRGVLHGRVGIGVVTAPEMKDFERGRRAAAHALAELGERLVEIPASEDRAPVWPPGIAGSIAHTRDVAVAIVVPANDFTAVGVDVEAADRRVEERTTERIGTPQELAALPDPAALILFCAKEATYKALAPLGATRLGFHDVVYTPTFPGVLEGRLVDDTLDPRVPRTFSARYAVADGYVVSAVQVGR